jgi:hypothetical protein
MLEQFFCPYCASAQQVVNVHGHKQCVKCGINVSPCCSGEQMTEFEYAGFFHTDMARAKGTVFGMALIGGQFIFINFGNGKIVIINAVHGNFDTTRLVIDAINDREKKGFSPQHHSFSEVPFVNTHSAVSSKTLCCRGLTRISK